MKVVFLEDVEGVALGVDVKEVKNGFAKNYLIPSKLAAPATHNNLPVSYTHLTLPTILLV